MRDERLVDIVTGACLVIVIVCCAVAVIMLFSGCDDWRCHEGDCLPTHRCVQQQSYQDCGYEYDFFEDRFAYRCHTRWKCVRSEPIRYETYGTAVRRLGRLER